jgi:hypothetical protein
LVSATDPYDRNLGFLDGIIILIPKFISRHAAYIIQLLLLLRIGAYSAERWFSGRTKNSRNHMNWVSVSNGDVFLEVCILEPSHRATVSWNSLVESLSTRSWRPPQALQFYVSFPVQWRPEITRPDIELALLHEFSRN